MKKLFFIIGMRRSGTSVLRDLLIKHHEIMAIEFEPHPLWFAVDMNHFARFKDIPYIKKLLSDFRRAGSGPKWHGAKFALNPGVKALEWKWLPITFPEARFIFIIRNQISTCKSYLKQDKNAVRGYLPENLYYPLWNLVFDTFGKYNKNHPGKSCFVQYENLLRKTDTELKDAWKLLDIKPLVGMNTYIKKPEF